MRKAVGFTLAELLIALGILGVIATFTIPKVLQTQQDVKFKAIIKEVAGMMSAAFHAYKLNNTVSTSTGTSDLVAFFNYVKIDTVSTIDDVLGFGSLSCSSPGRCYVLHNGAKVRTESDNLFSGLTSTDLSI